MKFSRDDTRVAKATAVILMCMHHLFAFPNRFPEGVTYISMFPWDLEYDLGCVGKICVAMFVFLSGFGTYLAMEKTSAPLENGGAEDPGALQKILGCIFGVHPCGGAAGRSSGETDGTPFAVQSHCTAYIL